MRILVGYASRHGATQGIAERIAATLADAGLDADARALRDEGEPEGYDAFVLGSAVYMFRWLKDFTRFVHRHEKLLAARPVWLFSSGPLGTDRVDKEGRDVLEVSQAKVTAQVLARTQAREHVMFFGAWTRGRPIGLAERFVAHVPAARDAMPEGDFRDWEAVEAWAAGIAQELDGSPARTPGER
ncbi:MAG TPA: flavodoxin domain-containing protein [Thermoleophilia bacterium]|nr:flavodoxin domain-containing protein [Thermoleophilia bacterium]